MEMKELGNRPIMVGQSRVHSKSVLVQGIMGSAEIVDTT